MAEPAPIVNGVDNPHPLPINGADDGAGSSGDVTPNSEDSGVDCMHVDALELKEAVANGNSRRDAVEEEGKEEGTEEEKKDAKVEDVIVIQDAAFMVKLVPPSGEPFELQPRVCEDLVDSYALLSSIVTKLQGEDHYTWW